MNFNPSVTTYGPFDPGWIGSPSLQKGEGTAVPWGLRWGRQGPRGATPAPGVGPEAPPRKNTGPDYL